MLVAGYAVYQGHVALNSSDRPMTGSFCLLTSDDLKQLAGALRSERLIAPFSSLLVKRYVPESLAGRISAELQERFAEGMEARHMADCLELLCQDRMQRPVAEDLIDLVWTGPEAQGIVNRDTGVVVRELFQNAKESVLVVGYAVYQGHIVFKTLAERMDQNPQLGVKMFLDIQRPLNDQCSPSELVRRFGERFTPSAVARQALAKLVLRPSFARTGSSANEPVFMRSVSSLTMNSHLFRLRISQKLRKQRTSKSE